MQYRLKIRGLAISHGGLELNFLRRLHRRFIQPVTEAVHDFYYPNLPVR